MDFQQLKDYQKRKLVTLIMEVDELHGGNDVDFLNEYVAEVLSNWANDLQLGIDCFEDLKAQALALGKTFKQPEKPEIKTRTYHPAFREHYERNPIK
jgi:hypothetical protein